MSEKRPDVLKNRENGALALMKVFLENIKVENKIVAQTCFNPFLLRPINFNSY